MFVTYRFVPFRRRFVRPGRHGRPVGGLCRNLLPQSRGDQRGRLRRRLPELLHPDGEGPPAGGLWPPWTGLPDPHEQPPRPVPDVQLAGRNVGGGGGQRSTGRQPERRLELLVPEAQHPGSPAVQLVEGVGDQGAAADRAAACQRPAHRLDGDEALQEGVADHGTGAVAPAAPLGHVDHRAGRRRPRWQPGTVDVRRSQACGAAEDDARHGRAAAPGRDQHRHDLVTVADEAVEGGGRGPAEHRVRPAGEQRRPGLLHQRRRGGGGDEDATRGLPPGAVGDPRADVGAGEAGGHRVVLADDTGLQVGDLPPGESAWARGHGQTMLVVYPLCP
ncbi:hypothetical protein BBK14_28225 [Parafrankia soli]|uniref:Uncharacterized protein n=1 Tax=Parafrankia soli TaxID=2599596 RepID=A0A1S1PGL1_9ACTN|nr:hypothetical protein BBK14_28225 [Parafrankia soli]